jgi:predicted Na+-dependent transporter
MKARDAGDELPWWTSHLLILVFVTLVAAILAAVPGWSTPLHAWIALGGLVAVLLAAHAVARAAACAVRRRWNDVLVALRVAATLGAVTAMLVHCWHAPTQGVDDAETAAVGNTR